jgi:hypothetical protein
MEHLFRRLMLHFAFLGLSLSEKQNQQGTQLFWFTNKPCASTLIALWQAIND